MGISVTDPQAPDGRHLASHYKAVSRKVAKYAKVTKRRKHFTFAVLRAFATLRGQFWFFHTFYTVS
jgi:hypothetical protein